MGLGLEVGILADLKIHDPEGFELFQEQFDYLNQLLQDRDLPLHNEPTSLSAEQHVWSCDMWGYSGLHNLRRIAAHLAFGESLPPPLTQNERASQDPMIEKYYKMAFKPTSHRKWTRNFGHPKELNLQFRHLLLHSDAEGFYLPLDFEEIIQDSEVFGGTVGSSHQLLHECKVIAEKLELPLDMDHEAEELWDAASEPGRGEEKWQQYGVESFTCLRLIRACEVSIQQGAAIAFV